MKSTLIGHDHLDITGHREPGPVLTALCEASESSAAPHVGGFVWLFRLGSGDHDPTLAVGVRGEIGALAWYAGDDELVPVGGLNEAEADGYWTWFGHESPMPPRAEMLVADVYRALSQWVSTHQRPTCLRWRSVGA
jgi:hypothetical protein